MQEAGEDAAVFACLQVQPLQDAVEADGRAGRLQLAQVREELPAPTHDHVQQSLLSLLLAHEFLV
jgi:hypothetical protein